MTHESDQISNGCKGDAWIAAQAVKDSDGVAISSCGCDAAAAGDADSCRTGPRSQVRGAGSRCRDREAEETMRSAVLAATLANAAAAD